MYEIIKSVIESRNFKLSEMTIKIDTLWIESKLTEEQYKELKQLMLDNANHITENPDLEQKYERLLAMYDEIVKRILVLEEKASIVTDTEPEPSEVIIPKWVAWDGISKDYVKGSAVEHNGKYYKSEFSGQNTWEPGTQGTESFWVEITKEEAEEIIRQQQEQNGENI